MRGCSEKQEAIGVLESRLEAAGGFSTEGEISQRQPALDAGPLRLMSTSPNLDANKRRRREGEVIKAPLLVRLQQRTHDPHIERAGDAEVEVLGAVIFFVHNFERSFGPHDG